MSRPLFEVADVIRRHGEAFLAAHGGSLGTEQRRVLRRLAECRTAALGGHVDRCDACGHQELSYNSCRDRHCPKCQAGAAAEWFRAREGEILPVPYFHVVFTLPHELGPLALANRRTVYDLLMRTAASTLLDVAAKPRPLGARLGFFGILHTWTQTLDFHPHVHFVVPAGGLAPDRDEWIPARKNFLVPVRVLRNVFRARFLDDLLHLYERGALRLPESTEPAEFRRRLNDLRRKKWVVYSQPPFAGPAAVVKYLARYTHRVAISNARISNIDDHGVDFRYRDTARGGRERQLRITGTEFLRRFLMHVLPHRLVRIRYYGFLAARHRTAMLALCRQLLAARERPVPKGQSETPAPHEQESETARESVLCPRCRAGRMIPIGEIEPESRSHHTRDPPP
jgi:hypothetical protein